MAVVLVGAALAARAAPKGVEIGIPQTTAICEFRSVPDVAFGLHTGAMREVRVTIGFGCHASVRDVYMMMESPGLRRMSGPRPAMTSFIGYELYRQVGVGGALSVWGNSQQTAYYLASPPNADTVNVELIAQAAGASVPAGLYVDDLRVRLIYNLPPGQGGTQELAQSRQVTATAGAGCTLATTDLAFGNYDPLVVNATSDLDGAATITVSCSAGAQPIVWIAPGTGARVMTGPGNLSYELYRDAGRTAIWGSAAGSAVQLPTSTGVSQTLTVYGRVPRGQNVPVGAYSQSVTVTMNF